MKKITILAAALAMLASCSTAQVITPPVQITEGQPPSNKVGWNMANAVESITTVQDSNFFVQVIPEGASFQWRDRYDKHNEDPQDIINIYKWLQKHGRSFEDVFVATDSVGFDNAGAIAQLKAAGVPIKCAEYVNEAFYPAGGYTFDWNLYEPKLLEFIYEALAVDPQLSFGIPIAPKPSDVFTKEQGGSNSHKQWNDAAFAFMDAHPEWSFTKIIHIYYTGAFVPELGAVLTDETGQKDKIKSPTKRVYNYQTDTLDESYWRNIFYQSDPTIFWEPMLNYLSDHAPGRPTRVTECGYIGAGELNGSWTFAAKAFELVNMYGSDPRHEGLHWHGGFTKSRVGIWSPRDPADYRDPENPNNVSTPTADAFELYFHAAGLIYKYRSDFQITSPGKYSFWYLNGEAGFTPVINVSADLDYTYTVKCITGERFSSLGTTTDATKKGSVLGPGEVSRIEEKNICPGISFGYIEVTVNATPISRCTDPIATNYNPLATVDNGTCSYPPPPPPPTVCYKQRLIFKSLGCKVDKTCQVNNCKK